MRTVKFYRDGDKFGEPTRGVFHEWAGSYKSTYEGTIPITKAIVELGNGSVEMIDPWRITFTDKEEE